MEKCCKKNVARLVKEAGENARISKSSELEIVVGGGCNRCGLYAEVVITVGVS